MKSIDNLPALTICVSIDGKAQYADVDFTPIIRDTSLDFLAECGWPRHTLWPSNAKIEFIKNKHSPNLVAMRPFYWQLSFAEAEKCLATNLDGGKGCRKKAHRIMKELNSKIWCPSEKGSKAKPAVSSYILKVAIQNLD